MESLLKLCTKESDSLFGVIQRPTDLRISLISKYSDFTTEKIVDQYKGTGAKEFIKKTQTRLLQKIETNKLLYNNLFSPLLIPQNNTWRNKLAVNRLKYFIIALKTIKNLFFHSCSNYITQVCFYIFFFHFLKKTQLICMNCTLSGC